jgi:hypothetical protein
VQAVSDLTQTQIFDKEQNVGLLYKVMKIASITISSTMGAGDTPVRCCHRPAPRALPCFEIAALD